VKVEQTSLPGVMILEPKVFEDDRGFFMESWNANTFRDATGLDALFVQDNHSRSARNVLRGIHYQLVKPQGKLVRVLAGEVFDVAVDLRRSSQYFGRWCGVLLSAENKRQLWIPPGFGHAFLVVSQTADFFYKTTEYWSREHDRTIVWNDSTLAIDWPLKGAPVLAAKDAGAPEFAGAETFS
jgi:dTDP-4-dehydrorhamnose 3,5-epimerase